MSHFQKIAIYKIRSSALRLALEVDMELSQCRVTLYNTNCRRRKVHLNFMEQKAVAEYLEKHVLYRQTERKEKIVLTRTSQGLPVVSLGLEETFSICKENDSYSYSAYFPPQAVGHLTRALAEASEFFEKAVYFLLRSDGKDFYEKILPYIMAKCVEQEAFPCYACRWTGVITDEHYYILYIAT